MKAGSDGGGMTEVFVARGAALPSSLRGVAQFNIAPTDCFRLHRVHWQETRVSEDGSRLICRFRAPDAESVRIALRQSGIPFDAVWTGGVVGKTLSDDNQFLDQ